MKKLAYTLFLVISLFLFSGCGTVTTSADKSPRADLTTLKKFYVVKLAADERGMQLLIVDRLKAMGYEATWGLDNPDEPVDAIVTYQDKWIWDLSMYLFQLNIQLRDGQTKTILASGSSMRPSMKRTEPAVMVEEVLTKILSLQ